MLANCVIYETVTDSQGELPWSALMFQIAGLLSIQAGTSRLWHRKRSDCIEDAETLLANAEACNARLGGQAVGE